MLKDPNFYIKRWMRKLEFSPDWYVVEQRANGITCRTVEKSRIIATTPLAVIATYDKLVDGRNWLCISYTRLNFEGGLATTWRDGKLVRETFFEPDEVIHTMPPKGTDMEPFVNQCTMFHCLEDYDEQKQLIHLARR